MFYLAMHANHTRLANNLFSLQRVLVTQNQKDEPSLLKITSVHIVPPDYTASPTQASERMLDQGQATMFCG